MKIGAIVCLVIFVSWVALALLELWFNIVSGDLFWKLTITAAAFFVVVLGISLVVNEYIENKKSKDDGYID